MKTFIIALMTADGFIAQDKDHLATAWANEEDKHLFRTYVKQANNMVMGLKTFMTTAAKSPTVFNKSMPGRRLFVYTHDPQKVVAYPNVEAVSEPPEVLVKRLAAEGVQELAVCGGAQIYDMFMQAGVVDHLYIDVQATLFGTGVTLFTAPIQSKIILEGVERLGGNNVLLHYKTVR